jgi:hypothetical protein
MPVVQPNISKVDSNYLICITTCARLDFCKVILNEYLKFVKRNIDYDFILALDGRENDYIAFCEENKIPLLYSEEREGVGVSKNRVLSKYPNYDGYFFIEDDIELLNPAIFDDHIKKSKAQNINHFSLSKLDFKTLKLKPFYKYYIENKLGHAYFGGAQFNYFSKKAIDKVGGFHSYFAQYKRYGHTEHSHRIYKANLNPSPFVFYIDHYNSLLYHDPEHVTKVSRKKIHQKTGLLFEEYEMLNKNIAKQPLYYKSEIHTNSYPVNLTKTLVNINNKYPFLNKEEKKVALSNFYFNIFFQNTKQSKRLFYLFKALNYKNNRKRFISKVKNKLF